MSPSIPSVSRALRALLVLFLVLFAVACGDDDGGDNGASSDTTASDAGPSETTAAQGDGWDEIVAAAEEEGRVVLYSLKSEELNAELETAFEDAYPDIDLESVRLSSGEMVERIEAEADAGSANADVVWHSENPWQYDQAAQDRFLIPEGPAVEEWDPADYEAGVVRMSGDPYVLAYNTSAAEPLEDYEDLLNPDYAGRIAWIEPIATAVYVQFQNFVDHAPAGFNEDMAEIGVRWYQSLIPIAQAVASGEATVAGATFPYLVEDLKAQGAPIEWVAPESGTYVNEGNATILAEAPHSNAAQVLMDFMMSRDGQTLINGNSGLSVLDDIEGAVEIDRDLLEYFDYASWDIEEARQGMREIYGKG